MARRLVALAVLALGFGLAQNTRPSGNSVIEALLAEVRQLRLVLDRSAQVSARIQIVLHRVETTQHRADRLSEQLQALRKEIADAASWDAHLGAELKVREARAGQEQNEARRKELEQEMRAMKNELERRAARQPQEQGREADILGQLQAEQTRLSELSDELNRLEKSLPD